MSTSTPLYTFILAHYGQEKYITTALDSIFSQTYPNIELIVIDDSTPDFSAEQIRNYVAAHKSKNITRFELIVNEQNQGTVRLANTAFSKASGEFLHFFAADDRLANENVAQNFVNRFHELGENAAIISAQTMMYDDKLEEIIHPFMTDRFLIELNTMTAQEQYRKNMERCIFAIGATCFRRSLWEQYGPFDTSYRLIEDWPFFIKITRAGVKIFMAYFDALDHRSGGVTAHADTIRSSVLLTYKEDVLSIFENSILPYLKKEPIGTQLAIYECHHARYLNYKKVYPALIRPTSFFRILSNSPYLALCLVWNNLVERKKTIVKRGVIGSLICVGVIAILLLIVALPSAADFSLFNLSVGSFFSYWVMPFVIVLLLFLCYTAFGVLFNLFFWAREALKRIISK